MGRKAAVVFALIALLAIGAFPFMKRLRRSAFHPPAGAFARRAAYAELVRREPTAANFMLLGAASANVRMAEEARRAYFSAAQIYRQRGLISEGYVAEQLAQRYEVVAQPYLHLPSSRPDLNGNYTRAKYEPIYGCYLGAFIDHEDSIRGTYRDEYGEWRRDASAFNHLTNKHHAIFFIYVGYGRNFPAKFVRHMNDNGAAAQLALEPTDLDKVRDDRYLHDFARAARESRTPIFLRFASEMNGDWVPYHGNPAKYIEKFRLVARVMHREAPNVVMVWCPFEIPVRFIPTYYPGADAVDWVGLNVYSVPFWDNNPKRVAMWRNPADSLRYVYGLYAARHPIMVCEYAASHRSSLDGLGRTEFARDKMGQFYASLPRQYPRVKAVCWLSMNAIKHAIPGRQSNDYALLDDRRVLERYREISHDPYFLDSVPRAGTRMAKENVAPLRDGMVIRGRTALSAWVKVYDEHPTVVWKVNGAERWRLTQPGPYRWVLDPKGLPPGPATIEMSVLDAYGQELTTQTRRVIIAG